MNIVSIKKATAADLDRLQIIGRDTFSETFAPFNTRDNLEKYLEVAFADSKLAAELKDQNSEFYFAEVNDDVIGYLKINFGKSQTELQDDNAMEIERIYVLKSWHGRKAGKVLLDHAVGIARSRNVQYVWLGVWQKNLRALTFYKKNGFTVFDTHVFKMGNALQTDYMMKLELLP